MLLLNEADEEAALPLLSRYGKTESSISTLRDRAVWNAFLLVSAMLLSAIVAALAFVILSQPQSAPAVPPTTFSVSETLKSLPRRPFA